MNPEDVVQVRYAASSNITFRGKGELPYTREEWDGMDGNEQNEALAEFLFQLVDIYVEDD